MFRHVIQALTTAIKIVKFLLTEPSQNIESAVTVEHPISKGCSPVSVTMFRETEDEMLVRQCR